MITPKQRAHDVININTKVIDPGVYMSTEVVYSYLLGKKFAFNLNSYLLYHQLHYYYYYYSIIVGKYKAKRPIKDLYETVEPNQYARNKSMLEEF